MGTWVSGRRRLPSDDSHEDFPRQYTVRFKGDDPRSGWVDTAIMTAKELHEETYDDYWEWYDDSESPIPASIEERAKEYSEKIIPQISLRHDSITTSKDAIREDVYDAYIAGALSVQGDGGNQDQLFALISKLKELQPYHINPYNLGESGEISNIIDKLYAATKKQ